jgi:hypothetical protein
VDDEYLTAFALLDRWKPFEAACLINGLHPGAIKEEAVWVGREPDPAKDEGYENDPPADPELAAMLINHARIIRRNYGRGPDVPAREVVRWAVENKLLKPSSYLSRRLLGGWADESEARPNYDDLLRRCLEAEAALEQLKAQDRQDTRGGHFAEHRKVILGAAMRALVSEDRRADVLRGEKINAAALADQIHDFRHRYNIPDEGHGYSHANILKAIRDALKASASRATTDKI